MELQRAFDTILNGAVARQHQAASDAVMIKECLDTMAEQITKLQKENQELKEKSEQKSNGASSVPVKQKKLEAPAR